MTDTPRRHPRDETTKERRGIAPAQRSKERRRPASFLTLSAVLHAAFLLLLSPLIFISGDMAPGNLDSISVTVLVDDKPVTAEPAPVPEKTEPPREIVPTTDPLDPDTEHTDDNKTGPSYAAESGGDDAADTGETLSGIPGDDPVLSRYISRVRTKIERRKYYPASSRRMKEEGTVTVSFLLTSAGDLVTLSVASSSGFPDLDDAALDAVRKASPYPPFPATLGTARLALKVPITYELK